MGKEIERKFLLATPDIPENCKVVEIQQGYFDLKAISMRIRLVGKKCLLTIKSREVGASRSEFEYPIPMEDGLEMLRLCHQPIIRKKRHLIRHEGKTWEVDKFEGENQGLQLAELELEDENEEFRLPDWIGEEVTGNERYSNAYLAEHPFSSWSSK